jgi:hypothetical protein
MTRTQYWAAATHPFFDNCDVFKIDAEALEDAAAKARRRLRGSDYNLIGLWSEDRTQQMRIDYPKHRVWDAKVLLEEGDELYVESLAAITSEMAADLAYLMRPEARPVGVRVGSAIEYYDFDPMGRALPPGWE